MSPLSSIASRSMIGIDCDGRFIRAVQLAAPSRLRRGRVEPARPRLVAALRVPREVGGAAITRAEVSRFSGAMVRQGFSLGTRIVLAIPDDKIVAGILELPPRTSGAPLAQIARAELASMHDYDPGQAETVSWDLPPSKRVKNATQAMAVACRHTDAESLLEVFEGAGLQIEALDSRLHAIVRACRPLASPTGITAILELEWDWAVLVLLYQGVVIYRWSMAEAAVCRLTKTLAAGLKLDENMVSPLLTDVGLAPQSCFDAAVCDVLGTSIRKHLDAAAESMQSPILYAAQQFPGASVARLLVTGHGAAIPGAADHLRLRMATEVKTVVPADLVEPSAHLAEKSRDPSLVGVVGLAEFEE
jgi:Tfp pilus assembly PilM family ATPase